MNAFSYELGITIVFASLQDSDRDGILNEYDDDDDNDGIPDIDDLDANGDGIPDCVIQVSLSQ